MERNLFTFWNRNTFENFSVLTDGTARGLHKEIVGSQPGLPVYEGYFGPTALPSAAIPAALILGAGWTLLNKPRNVNYISIYEQ